MFLHRIVAQLAHQRAHDWLQLGNGTAFAVKVHNNILIQQAVILTVVIPD